MVDPIINIYRTVEEALYFRNSQLNTKFIFSGVQLLPFQSFKYQQVTNTPSGLNLEDWTVKVLSLNGEELADITDSFMVEKLTNSDNGNPQFVWSLTNILYDFGWQLVYLKITQSVGETFYTQPFMITDIENEKTSTLTYRFSKFDEYQTIGVRIWYRESDLLQELTTYNEESTNHIVTTAISENEVEYWMSEKMPRNLTNRIKQILALPYNYVNFIRSSMYQTPEIAKSQSQENFAVINVTLSFDYNDTYSQPSAKKGDFKASDFKASDFLIYE